ncbi:hypothetical protein KC356_g3888 [Hortaea werneckii]|nr:hypothetical protein KC356_g3888 [Hortaea werneckii]
MPFTFVLVYDASARSKKNFLRSSSIRTLCSFPKSKQVKSGHSIVDAGAGFHNTSKGEGSSPSLHTSQLNAKNAGAESPVSPRRYSETTSTPDDEAHCSDDERRLMYTNPVIRPSTTHPNEHYVYEVDKFRALSFLVDRALEELPFLMAQLVEVVEIPKQRHSRRRDVPYTELSDLPPSRDDMRWQNVIMQLLPSSTS